MRQSMLQRLAEGVLEFQRFTWPSESIARVFLLPPTCTLTENSDIIERLRIVGCLHLEFATFMVF